LYGVSFLPGHLHTFIERVAIATTYLSNNQWHFIELRMASGQIQVESSQSLRILCQSLSLTGRALQVLVDGAVTGLARGSSVYTLFNIPPNRIVSIGGHLEASVAVLNISDELFPLTQAQQSGDFSGYLTR
jgi:hypothetical protein